MSSKNKFLINSKKLEANILVKVRMREKIKAQEDQYKLFEMNIPFFCDKFSHTFNVLKKCYKAY